MQLGERLNRIHLFYCQGLVGAHAEKNRKEKNMKHDFNMPFQIEDLIGSSKIREVDSCFQYDCLNSNLNYLKNYGQQYYDKMIESFAELKKLTGLERPVIFSFGSGASLEYIASKSVFGNVIYHPIDECEWAFAKTEEYKKFFGREMKVSNYDGGLFLLSAAGNFPVICFFNSLHDILETKDVENDLIPILGTKQQFAIVCNFTRNRNYHKAMEEKEYIDYLVKTLKVKFNIKQFEILGGEGIIVMCKRK